jgi:RNA polymerase sigma-70 factor (ECF subfamily)
MTTDVAGIPDAELMVSLVRGDASALAELYDRHADTVFRAAYRRLGDRQLAEEVVQDTWVTLWDRAELYDPASGSLVAWLSTIARNRAVDRLRALARRPGALPLSAVYATDPGDEQVLANSQVLMADGRADDPQLALDELVLRDTMIDALSTIPAGERQVLELAYYAELTQPEIALRLGWPLGTVKTRTRRALLRLRATLSTALGPDLALTPADDGVLSAPEEVPDGPS